MSEFNETEAWEALFSGNLAKAVPLFNDWARRTNAVNAYVGLLIAASVMDAKEQARALVAERASAHAGQGVLIIWRAAWLAARNRATVVLDKLWNVFCEERDSWVPETAPIAYARGMAAMIGGDLTGANPEFQKAKRAFAAHPEVFIEAEDRDLTSILYQCLHVPEQALLDRLSTDLSVAPAPAPNFTDAPPPGSEIGPILVTAADGHYLRTFGPSFVSTLSKTNPGRVLHIHGVDAEKADIDALRSLGPELDIRASLNRSERWNVAKPAVYASTRFLMGPHLLDHYRAPLLFLDIDLEFDKPLDPLLETTSDCDFACWMRPDGGPGGYAFAVATGFSPWLGREMLVLAGKLIEARFAEDDTRLWFVDQVALYFALTAMQTRRSNGFKAANFQDSAGDVEKAFFHQPETQDKRR